jgi:hypothetical protein
MNGVILDITINGKEWSFYASPRTELSPIRALDSRGKRLHFLSQDMIKTWSSDGKTIVSMVGNRLKLYFERMEMVSRMEFKVRVEKSFRKNIFKPKNQEEMTPNQGPFSVSVKNESGHEIVQNCSPRDMIQHLKELILDIEEITPFQVLNGNGFEATSGPVPVKGATSGSRGLTLFGEKTDQQFTPHSGFEQDPDYDIEPFVIELRMKPRLTF